MQLSHLRRVKAELFLHPVIALPAIIVGWEEEDKEKAKLEWGQKMQELVVEPFSELEVEVVECCPTSGRCRVKVPSWESAFVRKEVSKAAQLLSRIKNKGK